MVIKKATQVGDPIIRRRSKPALVSSKRTKIIIRDLIDSMRYHGLVGMAAPQIGINLRIFVTEVRKTKTRNLKNVDPLRIFINPRIVQFSKQTELGYEGCGSVAVSGLFAKVKRPSRVKIVTYDERGKRFTLDGKGLLARIIQHEMDHLDGKVFLDRMPDPKSFMSREEYMKK